MSAEVRELAERLGLLRPDEDENHYHGIAYRLPTLEEALDALEEQGVDCPEFDRDTTNRHYVLRRGMPDDWGHSQRGSGSTRLEAALRLLEAVRGD